MVAAKLKYAILTSSWLIEVYLKIRQSWDINGKIIKSLSSTNTVIESIGTNRVTMHPFYLCNILLRHNSSMLLLGVSCRSIIFYVIYNWAEIQGAGPPASPLICDQHITMADIYSTICLWYFHLTIRGILSLGCLEFSTSKNKSTSTLQYDIIRSMKHIHLQENAYATNCVESMF